MQTATLHDLIVLQADIYLFLIFHCSEYDKAADMAEDTGHAGPEKQMQKYHKYPEQNQPSLLIIC